MWEDPNSVPAGGYGGDGGIAGAVIQTGGALYDSYQNRQTSIENTKRTIAAQKSEAELAYQRAVRERDYQNWYNSPEQQMNRFKGAGLNPHLIYGQGSAGLQSGTPAYQPANLQYKYEAGQYGAAVSGALPILMQVGTWMQNMRLSEAELSQKMTNTERARQMIEYLESVNPELIQQSRWKTYQGEHQTQIMGSKVEQARAALYSMGQEFRQKYGEELWKDSKLPGPMGPQGGLAKLKYIQESAAAKLAEAKASWSEFDITDPQAIMMLVLNGVMGLAGQTLRLPSKSAGFKGGESKFPNRPKGVRRVHPSRRVQQKPKGYYD